MHLVLTGSLMQEYRYGTDNTLNIDTHQHTVEDIVEEAMVDSEADGRCNGSSGGDVRGQMKEFDRMKRFGVSGAYECFHQWRQMYPSMSTTNAEAHISAPIPLPIASKEKAKTIFRLTALANAKVMTIPFVAIHDALTAQLHAGANRNDRDACTSTTDTTRTSNLYRLCPPLQLFDAIVACPLFVRMQSVTQAIIMAAARLESFNRHAEIFSGSGDDYFDDTDADNGSGSHMHRKSRSKGVRDSLAIVLSGECRVVKALKRAAGYHHHRHSNTLKGDIGSKVLSRFGIFGDLNYMINVHHHGKHHHHNHHNHNHYGHHRKKQKQQPAMAAVDDSSSSGYSLVAASSNVTLLLVKQHGLSKHMNIDDIRRLIKYKEMLGNWNKKKQRVHDAKLTTVATTTTTTAAAAHSQRNSGGILPKMKRNDINHLPKTLQIASVMSGPASPVKSQIYTGILEFRGNFNPGNFIDVHPSSLSIFYSVRLSVYHSHYPSISYR